MLEPEPGKLAATAPAATAEIERRIADLSSAITKEKLSESMAEALKAESGPAGEAMADIADERVSAAIEKLKLTNAVKDLKEVKRIKTENAQLKRDIAALEARLKKLEGGASR